MNNKATRREFFKKSILTAGGASLFGFGTNLNATSVEQVTTSDLIKEQFANLTPVTNGKFIQALNSNTAKNNKTLKIGIVGIGGRGLGSLKNALDADKNIQIWAVGDIKPVSSIKSSLNKLKKYGSRAKVASKRIFSGFNAYQKVIDSGVDIILLTTPPAFRPLHIKAAVDANKHIFAEKPLAVDAPGLRVVMEATKQAQKKNLSFLTGFVWRYTKSAQDIVSHLLTGDFGRIINVKSQYLAAGRPKALGYGGKILKNGSFGKYISKWQNYLELGGDSLIEQAIHGVDKISWAMGDSRDLYCLANGGQSRFFPSNTFDNFSVMYNYNDGRVATMFSRQIPKTVGGTEEIFMTDKGYGGNSGKFYNTENKKVWESKESKVLGYVNEHKILYSHIRAGKVFSDDIHSAITSTGMALMGRMAAYTGQRVSWDDMIESKEMLFDNEKQYKMKTPYSIRPLAQPGITKLI